MFCYRFSLWKCVLVDNLNLIIYKKNFTHDGRSFMLRNEDALTIFLISPSSIISSFAAAF